MKINKYFGIFAKKVAIGTAHPAAFASALALIIGWGICGPFFRYSNTWQLIINTGTTIITFLMVFLIQHTQNNDTMAIHIKLDELLRAVELARNDLIDLEDLSEEEVTALQREYAKIAAEFKQNAKKKN